MLFDDLLGEVGLGLPILQAVLMVVSQLLLEGGGLDPVFEMLVDILEDVV